MPGEMVRYRCVTCGNLTRFDVVLTRREKAYHHFTTSGALTVEDVEVLAETVESVTCRWCGPSGSVVVLTEWPAASPADVPSESGAVG